MRNHGIRFENCTNNWENGLPIGNGVFGSLIYYKENKLFIPLNHYEIYYNISKRVLPKDQLAGMEISDHPGSVLEERRKRAAYNDESDNGLFSMYDVYRNQGPTSMGAFTGSYPQTGDLTYSLCDCMQECNSLLKLDVEKATVTLECEKDDKKLSMATIFARQDLAVTKINQSKHGLVKKLNLSLFPVRDADFPEVEYYTVDNHTFGWKVKLMLTGSKEDDKPFEYAGTVRLVGATAALEQGENQCDLIINAEKEFTVLTTVCTDWRYEDPAQSGIELIDEYEKNLVDIYKEHKEYWEEYFSHCAIELPDQFIERVWYINQYALDCCSGKDGIMKHHACGLNGLWDVKRPTLWGSLWYWDVNIQAAFAGVFSSNHMHLGKVFSDGLNTYTDLAKRYAMNAHGKNGIAFDYPYTCYFSVWPWCAQYLWQQYEYTQDLEYLRNEAYPLFKDMAVFALEMFEYDEKKDRFFIYPDISPEQGPLSHNTVITIGATKKFLQFTLEAAELLGDNDEMIPALRNLYEKMPDYPTTEDGNYGKRYLDSEEAPANLWIRHPGMLMPCFPAGEAGLLTDCPEKQIEILKNTLSYLEDRCEVGVFGGSWLAAAAARLGQGQKALRFLYEMGMDHMLRSNGLCAEETERFINHCLLLRQPIYYPCMVEYTGEMICALNEMLIQSFGKAINVFPALPDGDPEYARVRKFGYSNEDMPRYFATYDGWKDVRIDTMRTRGAFLVSAKLTDGKLNFIKVDSLAGKHCRVTSPYIDKNMQVFCNRKKIDFVWEDDIICFDTVKGESYVIGSTADAFVVPESKEANDKVTYHTSVLKHRVYLGENADTAYQKAIDGFTRDSMFGSQHIPNRNVYRFDFGYIPDLKKNDNHYNADRFYQIHRTMTDKPGVAMTYIRMYDPKERLQMENFKHQSGTVGLPWYNNRKLFDPAFSIQQGFGFKDITTVNFCDSEGPDILRRDFAEGTEENEFIIEVNSGAYEMFVCSGDANEDSVTLLSLNGNAVAGGEVIKKGSWQCKILPVVMENDGYITLKVSTKSGYKWKMNFMHLNRTRKF